MKYITNSPEETKKLAGKIISELLNAPRSKALVFGLYGELGAGKTQFAQGVAQFLGVDDPVTSPTFIIMNRYNLSREHINVARFLYIKNLYHFDCYRVNSSKEILDLGWGDIIKDSQNTVLIEWPERILDVLPDGYVSVTIKHVEENIRRIEI